MLCAFREYVDLIRHVLVLGDIRLRGRIAIGWRSYCVWRQISVRRHDDYSVIKRLVGQDVGGIDVEFCVSRSGG